MEKNYEMASRADVWLLQCPIHAGNLVIFFGMKRSIWDKYWTVDERGMGSNHQNGEQLA